MTAYERGTKLGARTGRCRVCGKRKACCNNTEIILEDTAASTAVSFARTRSFPRTCCPLAVCNCCDWMYVCSGKIASSLRESSRFLGWSMSVTIVLARFGRTTTRVFQGRPRWKLTVGPHTVVSTHLSQGSTDYGTSLPPWKNSMVLLSSGANMDVRAIRNNSILRIYLLWLTGDPFSPIALVAVMTKKDGVPALRAGACGGEGARQPRLRGG